MAKNVLDIREGWKVDAQTDLLDMGFDEFGTPYTAEGYHVVITDLRGRRLAHCHMFSGCETGQTEDGLPYFADTRPAAKKAVDTLVARIVDAGEVDLDFWVEIEPAYGSEQYGDFYGAN